MADNQTCSTAEVIELSGIPFTANVDTSAISVTDSKVSCDCAEPSSDNPVWYKVITNKNHGTRLIIETVGTDYENVVSVWRGTCDNLICAGCAWWTNFCVNFGSHAEVKITPGETLYVMIASPNGPGTGGNLVLSIRQSVILPTGTVLVGFHDDCTPDGFKNSILALDPSTGNVIERGAQQDAGFTYETRRIIGISPDGSRIYVFLVSAQEHIEIYDRSLGLLYTSPILNVPGTNSYTNFDIDSVGNLYGLKYNAGSGQRNIDKYDADLNLQSSYNLGTGGAGANYFEIMGVEKLGIHAYTGSVYPPFGVAGLVLLYNLFSGTGTGIFITLPNGYITQRIKFAANGNLLIYAGLFPAGVKTGHSVFNYKPDGTFVSQYDNLSNPDAQDIATDSDNLTFWICAGSFNIQLLRISIADMATIISSFNIGDGINSYLTGSVYVIDKDDLSNKFGLNDKRIEIYLNGIRQLTTQILIDDNGTIQISGLIEALRNDVITVKIFQDSGKVLNIVPNLQIHRVTYETHDKDVGRNLEENSDGTVNVP